MRNELGVLRGDPATLPFLIYTRGGREFNWSETFQFVDTQNISLTAQNFHSVSFRSKPEQNGTEYENSVLAVSVPIAG